MSTCEVPIRLLQGFAGDSDNDSLQSYLRLSGLVLRLSGPKTRAYGRFGYLSLGNL